MSSLVMEITTPLDPDTLLFHAMQGREEMSRLSEYQIDLLSPKADVSPDEILGKNVTVKVALPDDSYRYFDGYVTRFAQQGTYGRYHRYVATARPWPWFMTRTADCKIFQDMTVPEILKAVFADHTMASVKPELTATYRKWGYCVQYRETDFNFVSRLMEHEGISYYFTHEAGKHTMVLTDGGHNSFPGYDTIPFIEPSKLARAEKEHISSWEFSREVQPGLYVHDDYDFEKPSLELKTQKSLPRTYSPSSYEVYDYPGNYIVLADGTQYAGIRIEEFGSQYEIGHMATTARGVGVGYVFTLEGCPRSDQNRKHLVLSASYDIEFGEYEGLPDSGGVSYQCSFATASSSEQFRPRRSTPKPFVQGPQTAVVVGPTGGDEIYTDKYGRVKVQFHWDRVGKKDQNSSCWIRVSQPWAGKGWGAIAVPRMGQEVIVDFLEGDPDQPIITGRVYNADQMPPYALPENMTQTGIKSRSSKGGSSDNFNEIRFEDKKGSEQVFIHAEKDQDIEVEHDETHSVGHDRTKTIGHDETTHVKHDRTETVDNNETITIGVNRTESVGKAETITVGEGRATDVGKDDSLKVGKNFIVDAGDSVTIKTGDASITMQKDGTISIKGKDITIEGSGKINVKASSDVVVKGSKVGIN